MNAVVAVDKNWGIGKDNNLLFKIPEDQKFFKDITINRIVVMGRKTFDSIGKALTKRTNVVISSRLDLRNRSDIECYTKDEFDYYFKNELQDDIFIIGGASIYKQYYKQCENIYITKYMREYDADSYFPNLDIDKDFYIDSILDMGEYENYPYIINLYKKKH